MRKHLFFVCKKYVGKVSRKNMFYVGNSNIDRESVLKFPGGRGIGGLGD